MCIRDRDKATGNTSYRKADRAKVAELRANPNISSVEITGRKEGDPTDDEKSGGKKAKRDYDGDGKIESGSKEHAGAVHNAIQRKKGGVADGQDTRKEEVEELDEIVGAVAGVAKVGALAAKGVAKAAPVVAKGVVKGAKVAGKAISKGAKIANRAGKKVKKAVDTADKATDVALKMQELDRREKAKNQTNEEVIYEKEEKGEKKLDTMKGKNKVVINPKLGEQAEKNEVSPEDKKQLQMKKRMLQKKMMMQKQAMQMQRQGKLALNYAEESNEIRYCPKCDNCLLYTSPSPRDQRGSRMPSSA